MLTWYDGLSDVNLETLLAFQRSHRKLATVTTVRASARFGYFELDGEDVSRFREKPVDGGGWISGAFFVLEPVSSNTSRATLRAGNGTHGTACARSVSPRLVLAMHGYSPGKAVSRGTLGPG